MFWNASPVTARRLSEGVEQSGEQASFAFHHRGAVTALTTTKSGIQQVPEGVTEHVEGVDDNCQAEPRPERQPWRHLHESTPFAAQHPSPAGNLRGQTESEEAQRRLTDNHPADVDGEDDDDGRHNIGQHMADQDLARGGAHGFGCQKIVILFDPNHGASDDSGTDDASGDPQDHDDLEDTLSHDGHDGQQEQQSRKSNPGVDKALRSQVQFTAKES